MDSIRLNLLININIIIAEYNIKKCKLRCLNIKTKPIMRQLSILLILTFLSGIVFSQNLISVSGVVKSKEGNSLSGATIVLYNLNTKDSSKTKTKEDGSFAFSIGEGNAVFVNISYVGFESYSKGFDFNGKTGNQALGDILLTPGSNMLGNVTLEVQKVQIKEDTVSYKVDSTMYRKNDNVEALLKNLPGVQVDKDGTVTAQGKQVTKVKVNGKEFFNGDVTTATRELNADMVDRIQIIDDYGDQSAFTGIKDGDPSKTLNIELRKDKNKGYFGNATAGVGTDDRYLTSISLNKFNNDQQISILGNINNTNANTFNFGNGGGMGNAIGGAMRSMGIGRGGAGAGTAVGNLGNNDGLNDVRSTGINYRDNWGTKVSVYGSYSYSNKATTTIRNSTQQNIYQNNTSAYIQTTNNNTNSENHRASLNIEYKIDSMNYIKFNPSFSTNQSDNTYQSDFLSTIAEVKNYDGNSNDQTSSKSPNLSGNLLFNHKFKKRGRTISFNINAGQSTSNSDEDYDNLTSIYMFGGMKKDSLLVQQIFQNNSNKNYGGRISYTEPLTSKRNLEINYSYNYQFTGNDRKNYNIDTATKAATYVDASSNIYENTYETNRIGLNIRTTEKKYNYTVGLSIQPATIKTNSISDTNLYVNKLVNFNPVVRFAYNFSRSRSLNINYNGNTNQPSNAQLQPVVDRSNPQFITVGNPALKPEFTNTFSMRYNNFDFISGNVFFGNLNVSFTQDKIVNSVKLLQRGVQETKYANANGYFTAMGFYNMSKPIQNRKYVFNIGGNIGYNNNISILRDSFDSVDVETKNIGSNWVIGQRFSTDIKIKKWLETTIAANYSLNSSKNSIQSELNSNTVAWTLSNYTRIFLPKDVIISYDLDKTINDGLASNVSTNPLIITATIEKQLFEKKNVSLKLQGLDLLNENIGISRTVSSTGYTDTRSNRLGRYYLFTVVFRINKFKGQQQQDNMMMMPGGKGGGERMRMSF